ncbi:MAG: hypothetical protein F6J90_37210 [Moorea sp. SIOASIH]|nr:hypothetical protein [Moorena sp. SIOASIH]NEO90260.1 hypothetical protein [Moorena sp. SIO3G5]
MVLGSREQGAADLGAADLGAADLGAGQKLQMYLTLTRKLLLRLNLKKWFLLERVIDNDRAMSHYKSISGCISLWQKHLAQ